MTIVHNNLPINYQDRNFLLGLIFCNSFVTI